MWKLEKSIDTDYFYVKLTHIYCNEIYYELWRTKDKKKIIGVKRSFVTGGDLAYFYSKKLKYGDKCDLCKTFIPEHFIIQLNLLLF